jgi:hypothetical protein
VLRRRFKKDDYFQTFVVDYTARTYRVEWGLKTLPDAEALREPLTELRGLLGRSLKKSELFVSDTGDIIFENNTYLGRRSKD